MFARMAALRPARPPEPDRATTPSRWKPAAQRRLLEVDEPDAARGVQVVAGAGVAVQESVRGGPAEPAHQIHELIPHTRTVRDAECLRQVEEGIDVALVRPRPGGKGPGVGRAGGRVQAGQPLGVRDDPVVGRAHVVQAFQDQHLSAGIRGQQPGRHGRIDPRGEP
jgi:hypothetical protein